MFISVNVWWDNYIGYLSPRKLLAFTYVAVTDCNGVGKTVIRFFLFMHFVTFSTIIAPVPERE